jgi:hypothetical protein
MSEKLGSPEAIIRAEKRVLSHPEKIADSDRLNFAKTVENALLSGILDDSKDMRPPGTLNESYDEVRIPMISPRHSDFKSPGIPI